MKDPATKRNIPIVAIGLSLYEALPGTTAEQIGEQVIRTQWLYVVVSTDAHIRTETIPERQGS